MSEQSVLKKGRFTRQKNNECNAHGVFLTCHFYFAKTQISKRGNGFRLCPLMLNFRFYITSVQFIFCNPVFSSLNFSHKPMDHVFRCLLHYFVFFWHAVESVDAKKYILEN